MAKTTKKQTQVTTIEVAPLTKPFAGMLAKGWVHKQVLTSTLYVLVDKLHRQGVRIGRSGQEKANRDVLLDAMAAAYKKAGLTVSKKTVENQTSAIGRMLAEGAPTNEARLPASVEKAAQRAKAKSSRGPKAPFDLEGWSIDLWMQLFKEQYQPAATFLRPALLKFNPGLKDLKPESKGKVK